MSAEKHVTRFQRRNIWTGYLRVRSICSCDFRGEWRNNFQSASTDGESHLIDVIASEPDLPDKEAA